MTDPFENGAAFGSLHQDRPGAKWLVLILFSLGLAAGWPTTGVQAAEPRPPYAGWAMEAYPEASAAEMEAMVRRVVEHGANVVWIGHNNPGEVDAAKVEPGLSYAVYEAYLDPDDARHGDATAIVEAQQRMLAACRAVGVKAVLPVGYQIQMGQRWNEAHPSDLRRDAAGWPLDIYGGGVSASFYAPAYRRDIEAYYRWIEAEFVEPYADVLLMLNLADEPIGGDYSSHAEAEFRRQQATGLARARDGYWRYAETGFRRPPGFGFNDVGDDATRQRLLGEFQSRYVVEYAIYSARLWQQIHPGLPVTLSFDGGQARKVFTLPDVEAIFRDTPDNFVVTFDAYPQDGLSHVPLNEPSLVGLYLLVRSLGLYSARYEKPVWLWAAANSWGLSQASPDPGSVSDAVTNGLSLALLARQSVTGSASADLQGIAYWNYNVKEQGLYNDSHNTAYDTETMFQQVSAGLPLLRRLIEAKPSLPEVLILSPPARSYEQIGAVQEAIRLEVQPYQRLAILAKEGVNAAVVGSLDGWPLTGVRAVVILTSKADALPAADLEILGGYLAQGGRVVTSPGVAAELDSRDAAGWGVPPSEPARLDYGGLVERRGNLYIAQRGIAVLFEDKRHDVLIPFWRETLGLDVPQPGYRLVTDRFVFHYHLGADPVRVRLALPFEAVGYRYDDQARPIELLRGSQLAVTLGRREFVLLSRALYSQPRIE